MSRRDHFHESAGNPILGYSTDDGTVCRDCAKNDVELADIDPRTVDPIKFSHLGEGSDSYPDGFTCTSCGSTIGDWDYKKRGR